MNIYFITGTSKGIGYGLAIELLKNTNNFVFGLSRNNNITHNNFKHIYIDLSDLEQVKKFNFEFCKNPQKIVLINNSGIIGHIRQIGKVDNNKIIETYNINTIAPSILMNKFIEKYENENYEKIILNISSGAGRHSISSWATYCSSKSAIDMFSQVIFDEQQKNRKNKAVKIYSIAPGIVDTPMQTDIRKATIEEFEFADKFKMYKKNGELTSVQEVAEKLVAFIENSVKYKKVIYDIREIR